MYSNILSKDLDQTKPPLTNFLNIAYLASRCTYTYNVLVLVLYISIFQLALFELYRYDLVLLDELDEFEK